MQVPFRVDSGRDINRLVEGHAPMRLRQPLKHHTFHAVPFLVRQDDDMPKKINAELRALPIVQEHQ
jgi:hypothetical protein